MQTEQGQLNGILCGYKPHVRPADRFADRLRIGGIILVCLHVWFDELRCHQLHGVPETGELTGPVVSTPASLHPDQAGLQLRARGVPKGVPNPKSQHA
jgi:hypothetical protein